MSGPTPVPFGTLLRRERLARGLSQEAFCVRAGVSTRHLSFLENGRSAPSRELVGKLTRTLALAPHDRVRWFESAGYAAPVRRTSLDHPSMATAMRVVERLLDAHARCPAVAVDRRLDLVRANGPAEALIEAVTGRPDAARGGNLARLLLVDLRPHLLDFHALASTILTRLAAEHRGDDDGLLASLEALVPDLVRTDPDPSFVALPVRLQLGGGTLSFLSTITTLGTPVDLALHELRIETLLPLDDDTERFLVALSAGRDRAPTR